MWEEKRPPQLDLIPSIREVKDFQITEMQRRKVLNLNIHHGPKKGNIDTSQHTVCQLPYVTESRQLGDFIDSGWSLLHSFSNVIYHLTVLQ